MLIACPSSSTSSFVEPASLQPHGRGVCRRSVWRNEPTCAAQLRAAAEALAPHASMPEALVAHWPPNSPAVQAWRLPWPQILALVMLDSVVVSWSKDMLPQAAPFYATIDPPANLRGLDCDEASTWAEQHEGVSSRSCRPNETGGLVEVPRLKLLLRNTVKQEVYTWAAAAPSDRLPPDQTIAFASRLASSAGSSDVLVRFLNRRDTIAKPH
jgi:hypothetical protein